MALLAAMALLVASAPARAFDYFEHRWLGDVACAIAKQSDASLQCRLEHPMRRGVFLTFGDLVAMAGDHFGSPGELRRAVSRWIADTDPTTIDEILAARDLQLAAARSWLGSAPPEDVLACAGATPWLLPSALERPIARCTQVLAAVAARTVRSTSPPKQTGRCLPADGYEIERFMATDGFMALAIHGAKHFGAKAQAAWRAAAAEARRQQADPEERNFYGRATMQAAFGLHFFSDRFAAGHIRTKPGERWMPAPEAKRAHDYDNVHGLLVEARAVRLLGPARAAPLPLHWNAFGDRCLFGAPAEEHRALLALATAAALLRARGRQEVPLAGFLVAPDGRSTAFPRPEADHNPPVPAALDFWTLVIEPEVGFALDWRRNSHGAGDLSPGASLGGTLRLDPHWPVRSVPALARVGFGLSARTASNGLQMLGPLFVQLGAGSVDALLSRNVKLFPVNLRFGPLIARPPGDADYRFGLGASNHLRFGPPSRWGIDLSVGGHLLLPEAEYLGLVVSAALSASL